MNLLELIDELKAIDAKHDGETLQVFVADHFTFEDCDKRVEGAAYRDAMIYSGIEADVIIV
jgi:hypothetical protein